MTLIWLQISSMSLPRNKRDRVFLQQKTFSNRVNLSSVLYKVLNPLVYVRVFKLYDQQVLLMFIFVVFMFVVHSLPLLCKLLYCTMQYFSTHSSRIYNLCWMSVTMLYFCTEISFPTLYVKSVGCKQSIIVVK